MRRSSSGVRRKLAETGGNGRNGSAPHARIMVMPGRPAQPLAGPCTGVAPPRSIESSLPARAGACRPPPAPPNRRSRPHMSANQPTSASHNQLDTKAQAWSALFEEPMSDLVKRYTSSVFFDKRLWQADITGSLAHAEMLAAQGIIAAADHESIRKGMAQITQEIESGQFEWK